MSIKSGRYFLAPACVVLLGLLTGCGTTSASMDDRLNYRNEDYGFSISIPEEIYENISVEENLTETDGGKINFIYQKSHDDGTESLGILFTIEIKNKDNTDRASLDSSKIMGENDDSYFLFSMIEEPVEEMTIEKIYKENKEAISKIPDSFTSIFPSQNKKAERNGWVPLSQDYLKVLYNDGETALLYNASQDTVLSDKRPMPAQPWSIQAWNPETKRMDANIAVTEFSVLYEDNDGEKEARIKKVSYGGSTVLAVSDPELTGINFIPSPDGQKGIVWTAKGIWGILSDKEASYRLTEDNYSGHSYHDLLEEKRKSGIDRESEFFIYWNDHPLFDPEGSKLVYTSNRDIGAFRGNSIWYYDYDTGEERRLIKNQAGEYYNIIGWLDNRNFICQKSLNGVKEFLIVQPDGNSRVLDVQGYNIEILDISPNAYIAFILDYSLSNEIIISELIKEDDLFTGKAREIFRYYDRGIFQNIHHLSGGFSPKGEKYAFVFVPKDSPLERWIGMIDIKSGTVKRIDNLLTDTEGSRKHFYGVAWLNDTSLLGYIDDNGEKTTWIYFFGRRE